MDRAPGVIDEPGLERARSLIADAGRVVVLTGAGVSAESGVPTFRGQGGLWKSFRPEELATPEAFWRDPPLVWEWYAWRRRLVGDCAPNAAHEALARWAIAHGGSMTIVTQNVDGLHHRAADAVSGSADATAAYPIEVHGAIHRDRCSECDARTPGVTEVDVSTRDSLPHCRSCGGMLRPDVIWFGEALDPEVIGAAFAAAEAADLCLVVGTSALVYPAASVPDVTAARGGAVIEVNLDPTPLSSSADVSLRGEAGKLVPALLS